MSFSIIFTILFLLLLHAYGDTICIYLWFIFQIHDLPKPSYFHQSIFDLGIGSYEDIEVARYDTPIIEALNKFVKKRVSALPIVDEEGKLLDIYAKFDVIVRTKTNFKTCNTRIDVFLVDFCLGDAHSA